MQTLRLGAACLAVWSVSSFASAFAQVPPNVPAQVPGACETAIAERTTELGCYHLASEGLGVLSSDPLFWHIYEFPSHAAAEGAKDSSGTVVESLGKVWLFRIAAANWRSASGARLALVGPLPVRAGVQYVARYMEATFPPGIESRNLVHRHSGPEAWYLLSGTQCLETPDGATVVRAGQGGVVSESLPMSLTAVGNEVRRSLVLVLHDVSQPWATMVSDWLPKGLCPR